MKYFIIFLIASFVFFGCDANNAGDDSGIGSGDGSPQDDGSGSNEDEDPQDDNGGSNADEDPQDDNGGSNADEDPQDDNGGSNADDDPQVADLCLGVNTSSITHTLDDGKDYTIIRDQVGLQAISTNLAINYLLCADINIISTFVPLNSDAAIYDLGFQGDEFTGTFDGNNKTISSLSIQFLQGDYAGLFGKIGTDGEVRDLTLSLAGDVNNPGISGANYVGALAGENEGTITNVRVNGDITGNSELGGLVGHHVSGTITASHVTGTVTGTGYYIGGLVGRNNGAIEYSSVSSDVKVKVDPNTSIIYVESIGGLVGYNDGGTIVQSYASGGVTGSDNIGGLAGSNRSGTIEKSYAAGTVTGTGNGVGGLVGENNDDGGIASIIIESYFDATPTGTPTGQSQDAVGTNQSTNSPDVTPYYTYTDPNNGETRVYTEADGAGDLIAQGNFPDWDATIWTWQEGQWPTFQFQY